VFREKKNRILYIYQSLLGGVEPEPSGKMDDLMKNPESENERVFDMGIIRKTSSAERFLSIHNPACTKAHAALSWNDPLYTEHTHVTG
jgi:hypothetical protein